MTAGHPRSFTSVKQLQKGIDAYYAECKGGMSISVKGVPTEIDEPLSVSGLAESLGISRVTLHLYSKGEYDEAGEYSYAIKKAVAKIERAKIARATLGLYDKTICIFDLKNNHGWKDQQHIESNTNNKTQVSLDKDSINEVLSQLKAISDNE